jgi:hypothetical protein
MRPRVAHQISPFRKEPGCFAFSSRPFGHSQADGAVLLSVTEDLRSRQSLCLQLRHPQPRLRNGDRQFWICATSVDGTGFLRPSALAGRKGDKSVN